MNNESNFIRRAIPLFMQIASAKSRTGKQGKYQVAFMGNCLTFSHTCLPCLFSRSVSPCTLYPLMTELNDGSVNIFLRMRMALVPWGVRAILGNGY